MWKLVGNLPIRIKLALLAGVPVIGAVVLSLLIFTDAQQKATKARALGSVENLAELCDAMSAVSNELHMERARVALSLGRRAQAESRGEGTSTGLAELEAQFASTDRAIEGLEAFLARRESTRLTGRLAERLEEARKRIEEIRRYRALASGARATRAAPTSAKAATLERTMLTYRGAIAALTGATAALSELTDDGELLRLITSLVAVLEIEERASQEHAVLSYVFATDEFPPGSYRDLVSLLTESSTHDGVLRTNATADQLNLYQQALRGATTGETQRLRKIALESEEDKFGIDPQRWFDAQSARVRDLVQVEDELNRRVRGVALAKQAEMRDAVSTGLGLAGAVLVVSLVLGWVIATGVLASVRTLTSAAQRIGQGDLGVRAGIQTRDELGTLGRAFDEMVSEIELSRQALSEKARMTRELEIAASIQQSLLPPRPTHAEFEFVGRMVPADEVGGDFYDVLSDPRGQSLWITIGDVSNHGLGAGLVMMMTQAAFASYYRADPSAAPGAVLAGVNSMLCEALTERLKDDKYVTAQVLQYRGDGRFCCAGGHQSPLLYRARSREAEFVDAPGPWLGIVAELHDIPLLELQLQPDDVLCLYSDGITEARNDAGELFDLPRLEQALRDAARRTSDLDEIADHILDAVRTHTNRHDDDWTLLLVRRRRGGA